MITFVTVASWMYFISYSAWLGLIVYAFLDLTPWEQRRCTIKVNGKFFVLYMLAISWIISRFIG